MCLNPRWIYKKGKYKEDNYNGTSGESYEIGLFAKCGCCEICNQERANSWVVRNWYETKKHKDISFITLTYAKNPHILIRKDLTDFMKRLRRKLPNKVRMFGCGEYGELSHRPHMHVIIYGWRDEKKYYIGLNKKCNILYQSELIQKTWGKGRTVIDDLQGRAIPYISLYETPKEQFAKAYKLTLEKARYLRSKTFLKGLDTKTRKNLVQELNEITDKMKTEKQKYYAVKEFNSWSIGLGWEEFYKEFLESKENDFKCYIENKEFQIPTSWLKKLANMGYYEATEEIRRREKYIEENTDINKEITKNILKAENRKKKQILEWYDKKNKIELL